MMGSAPLIISTHFYQFYCAHVQSTDHMKPSSNPTLNRLQAKLNYTLYYSEDCTQSSLRNLWLRSASTLHWFSHIHTSYELLVISCWTQQWAKTAETTLRLDSRLAGLWTHPPRAFLLQWQQEANCHCFCHSGCWRTERLSHAFKDTFAWVVVRHRGVCCRVEREREENLWRWQDYKKRCFIFKFTETKWGRICENKGKMWDWEMFEVRNEVWGKEDKS